jgi:hypothetical protein
MRIHGVGENAQLRKISREEISSGEQARWMKIINRSQRREVLVQ